MIPNINAKERFDNIHAFIKQQEASKLNTAYITVYAQGLVNLSNKQDVNDAACTVQKLKALADKCMDIPDILSLYNIARDNLANKHNANDGASNETG